VKQMQSALSRRNEVLPIKKYGSRVEISMHRFVSTYLGRTHFLAVPWQYFRIVFALVLIGGSRKDRLAVLLAVAYCLYVVFDLWVQTVCILRAAGAGVVSWHERFKTLAYVVFYTPFFLWARLSGSWRERIYSYENETNKKPSMIMVSQDFLPVSEENL